MISQTSEARAARSTADSVAARRQSVRAMLRTVMLREDNRVACGQVPTEPGRESMGSLWNSRAVPDADAGTVMVRRIDARADDPVSLARLLEPLPESDELRARLRDVLFVRAWDEDAKCDYWVRSDGLLVTCFVLSGLTLKQAAAVRVRWDALRGRASITEDLLADLIARETGGPVTLAN